MVLAPWLDQSTNPRNEVCVLQSFLRVELILRQFYHKPILKGQGPRRSTRINERHACMQQPPSPWTTLDVSTKRARSKHV